MSEVKAQGFRVGYNGYTPKRIPLPSPPYRLRDPDRYVWIDGWNMGRRMAAVHWKLMEIEAEKLENENG